VIGKLAPIFQIGMIGVTGKLLFIGRGKLRRIMKSYFLEQGRLEAARSCLRIRGI
jgi:hypothetical protein